MSSETSSSLSSLERVSSLARSKLHLDKCNLHRWVLLKNSIIHAVPLTASSPSSLFTDKTDIVTEVEDEEANTEDTDSFMFPDAEKLHSSENSACEAQWLDSLLETLGDDDDDEYGIDSGSVLQADDEYDQMLSPLPSPMSSSDDLLNQSYLSPSLSYPYLAPYPPFHPPLVNSYHLDSYHLDSTFVSPSYVDPLPYYELDHDVADLPVPDAIEDTSDDESDSPLTPSVQSSSSLTLPIPTITPHVFIDSDDSFFNPYELDSDPLPFSDQLRAPYNLYQQEC